MADTISLPDLPKIKKHNAGDMKDMISNMPDAILHYILSLLSTKEADSANCLLDLVERLLHKSNHIERLCIEILKITVDVNKFTTLVSSAAKHSVRDLQLSIDDKKYLDTIFVLPNCLSAFPSLNKLFLELGSLLYVHDGICFSSLKTLNLSDVRFVDEKSVQQLFSGCPVLEELILYNFIWKNVNEIAIESSTLRTLNIHSKSSFLDYDHYDCCTVTINAPNISSLTCTSTPTLKFVVVSPISIVDANIGLEFDYPQSEQYRAECLFELLSALKGVKSLTMTSDTFQSLYFSADTLHLLPLFKNLTHLYITHSWIMDFTLEVLFDILHKTPKLEVLGIPMVYLIS
ncbi:F-box/FBD/LRR protein [Medicago truncatula]|uniref:F-box/FBD/LRR protein n=1 Tax=Medicago truncatula TaxID=3880 RepID=A0A072TXW3_MEDTR|nr:F-box/FBD/LRR protein [Medicago truncatula]